MVFHITHKQCLDLILHSIIKKFKVQLKVRSTNIKQHQRQNDRFIIDDVHQYTSSIHKLELINACRLYLQVTFLSEITNLDGDTIIYGATIELRQDLPTSKLKSTNQGKPNKKTLQVWNSALLTMYCNNGLSLKYEKKLHRWKSRIQLTQQHSYYFSPSCNEIFHYKGVEKYTRWMTNIQCQSITLCTATQESCDTIHCDCVSIQLNSRQVFKYLSQHNMPSSIPTIIRTLDKYIQHKPSHIRQLICNYLLNHNSDSLLELINNKTLLYISTNCAREDTESGGGWLIATYTGQGIVHGFNPDYGQSEDIHSYRSEVYAALASRMQHSTT